MTDKYPNIVAFGHTSNASQNKIRFHSDPVDATHIPAELKGFRTIFTSFHHFQPSEARALLQDAVDNQQGVGIFEVPGRSLFGRGKQFVSNVSGVSDKLVSGWGVDGVTIFQRGFPLKITYGGSTPLSSLGLGIGTLRPNVVPGCNKDRPSGVSQLSEWFNTACFTAPPAYGFGSESRADPTLRQKGVNNFDFSIFKRTTFGPSERMNVEFRTEFFNLFNHPQFAAPNTTLVSPNFGVVTSTLGNPRLVQFALKFAF